MSNGYGTVWQTLGLVSLISKTQLRNYHEILVVDSGFTGDAMTAVNDFVSDVCGCKIVGLTNGRSLAYDR